MWSAWSIQYAKVCLPFREDSVLSKLLVEEIIFVAPGGLPRPTFSFYMSKLILNRSIKNDTHKYNLKKIQTIDDHLD
jgi:hypothetical protein